MSKTIAQFEWLGKWSFNNSVPTVMLFDCISQQPGLENCVLTKKKGFFQKSTAMVKDGALKMYCNNEAQKLQVLHVKKNLSGSGVLQRGEHAVSSS